MIFLVDTSIITGGKLRRLLEQCAVNEHRVEVPALVHAEFLFQLRRKLGASFEEGASRALFDRFPTTLSVQTLDPGAAAALAQALHARFGDDAAWLVAKRAAWRRCLGQRNEAPEAQESQRKCGGSVDLYIAGLATPQRPIVTADAQDEWRGWPAGTVLSFEDALQRAEAP